MSMPSRVPSILGLFGDIGWYGLVPFIQKATGVLLLPVYTRYLTPDEYGVWALVLLVVNVPDLLADCGVTYSILRDYLDYEGEDAKEFLFTAVVFGSFTSVVAFGTVLVFGDKVIPLVVHAWEPEYYLFLQLALVSGVLERVGTMTLTFLVIERRPQTYTWFRLGVHVLTIGAQLYMLVAAHLGLMAIFGAKILGATLLAFGGIIILWPNLRPVFRTDALRGILDYSWQVVPNGLAGYVLKETDRWLIQGFLPMSELGVYSVGSKLRGAAAVFGDSVKKGWRPTFLKQIKAETPREMIKDYGNVIMEGSLIVLLFLVLFSKEAFQILTTPEYSGAYLIGSILVGRVFFQKIFSFVGNNALVYEKKLYLSFVTLVLVGIVNIAAGVLLVQTFGIEGAAMAVLLAFGLGGLLTNYMAARFTSVGCPIDSGRWALMIGLAALASSPVALSIIYNVSFWSVLGVKIAAFLSFSLIVAIMEKERIRSGLSRFVGVNVPGIGPGSEL